MTGRESPRDDRKPLSETAISQALARVADLWPEGLGAVPGTYEVALKADADTLRALAAYWRRDQDRIAIQFPISTLIASLWRSWRAR